jgi:hypothetical protein
MNDNEEKIYDLIGSKSFAELTEDERAMVLESLGSEELYEKMREANLAAEEALSDNLAPPAEMKSTVMAAFDEKDEKRGVVWWKYAAAVAALVVGAYLFWPSDNLEREPLAENVERKDSTERKKEKSEVETKNMEESNVENEQSTKDPEIELKEVEAPTITSSELAEESEKMVVAEIEAAKIEEEIAEMAFDDDTADDYTSPQTEQLEEELSLDYDEGDDAEIAISAAPEVAENFSSSDSAPVNKEEAVTYNANVTTARSAAKMSSDVKSQTVFPEGISLESIGGPDKNTYVAY